MFDQSSGLGLGAGLPTNRLLNLELVSAGGQGLLYRAHDAVLDRTVAVKILTGEPADGPLPQSVVAQARMSWHPNVMTLYDAGRTTNGLPYLIMEYLHGGSCEQLRRRGPVAVDRALRIGLELAEAIQAAHAQQIVHRDVKPSNVLLDADDHVRLGDFGLARNLDRTATTLNELQGSLMYVAPETLEGVRPGKASDVYALALTIRTLLTGEQPWTHARSIGEAIATRLQTRRLDFEMLKERPRLRVALEAATDSDPDRRPLLPDLIAELRIAAGRQHVPVISEPPRRRPRIAFAVAAVCLLIGAVVGFVARPAAESPEPAEAESVSPEGAFCSSLLKARSDHLEIIRVASTSVDQDTSAIDAVRSLFSEYPTRVSEIYEPVVAAARRVGLGSAADALAGTALANMALTDGLYRLDLDSRGLVDTQALKVRVHNGLPLSVASAAEGYVAILRHAENVCNVDQLNPRSDSITAAINDAVVRLSLLLRGPHMDAFFDLSKDGKRTARMFSPEQVDLILTAAPNTLGQFGSHMEWLMLLLENDSVRETLMQNHLGTLVKFLEDRFQSVPQMLQAHPEWVEEMRAAYREMPEYEQRGVQTYAKATAALGLGQ